MQNTPAPSPVRRKRQITAIAAIAEAAMAPALRQRGFANATILKEWPEIVGPALAGQTAPLEIRWPRRYDEAGSAGEKLPRSQKQERASQPVLTIACPSAFALEVSMATPRIIEAVNRRLGFGCIGSLRIVQTPKAPPTPARPVPALDPALLTRLEASLADIKTPELRAALARMGAMVAAMPKV